MEFYVAYHVLYALFFVVLIYFVHWYWNFKKKISGFPFYNLPWYILRCQISGKITKDTPLNNVVFEKIVEIGNRHMKEGHYMTYCLQPILGIYGEEGIKLFSKEKAALDKSPEYNLVKDVFKAGLVTSNGERWRKHRRLINPVFNIGMLKEKVPLFNQHAMDLVTDMDNLAGEESCTIRDVLKFHYFNALCESVLGLKQDKENKEKILKIFKHFDLLGTLTIKRAFNPWLRLKMLANLFHSGRKFFQLNKEWDDFIDKIISDMKSCVSSKNSTDTEIFGSHLKKSFTYILLNHQLNDSTFTLDDLRSEVRTIIMTGYDSTTISTMWCLFMLGLHPEVQENVYNEIQESTSDYITYEETSNLTYLEAVIMESLRLYPTVPVFFRNITEDVKYGKYTVMKGTSIAFCPYLSHRNPQIYPDPETFLPERFLSKEIKNNCTFMPFSEGSRSCIGKYYAILEMKIFLAHIIRNYKITALDRRENVKLFWSVGLFPVKRLRYKIEHRKSASLQI